MTFVDVPARCDEELCNVRERHGLVRSGEKGSVTEEESGDSKIIKAGRRRSASCRAEIKRAEDDTKTAETTTLTPFIYCS